MFDNRSLRGDISLVALIALIIFLTVSLVTYDPADRTAQFVAPLNGWYQPSTLVFPHNEITHNACGTIGATTADFLFSNLGVGAWYLLVGLATLAVALVKSDNQLSPWIRTIGWAVSLIGITSLASLVLPHWTPGPITGSGGYLGLLGRGMLMAHFALFGSILLALVVTMTGLMLWSDYMLLRFSRWLVVSSAAPVLAFIFARRPASSRSRRRPTTDLDLEMEEDDDEDQQILIRVGGRDVTDEVSDSEDEYEEEYEDEDEEDAEYEDEADDEEDEDFVDDEYEEEEYEEEEPVAIPVVVKTAAKQAVKTKKTETPDPEADKKAVVQAPHFKVKKPAPVDEREKVMMTLDRASRVDDESEYELPDIKMLTGADDVSFDDQRREALRNAEILEKTFAEFGFKVKVSEIETGPVIAQYEIKLEAGLRLSKITGLADDLAIALRVPSVRIVAPIPGKNTVGIEVPNKTRQVVRLREVMEQATEKTKKMKIPIFLGKDVVGDPMIADLASLPHLLIAGRTGTGKSVCLNSIISSILMTRRPDEVRMLMIDPKMVELSGYGRLPHLMHPVVTDMRKAEAILEWAVNKMEERYQLLAKAGVRHVTSFNQLGAEEIYDRLDAKTEEERRNIPVNLPFIVIIADEMADLMMTAGKEVEQHIIRLAQKSRAVGIHLILATQKPTVDVITGLIKSNLPARIAFQVASRTDSRVVLDAMGADKLLGNGDMLFLWPGTSTLIRGQGTYLSDDEIQDVTDACSTGEQNFVNELVNIKVADKEGEGAAANIKSRDELYEQAVETVISENRGSVSLLQRCLGIGYGRAARLIDYMEEDGIVGTYAGSKSREILMTMSQWEAVKSGGGAEQASEDISQGSPDSTELVATKSNAQAALEEILAEADSNEPESTAVEKETAAEQELDAEDELEEEEYEEVEAEHDEEYDEEDEEEDDEVEEESDPEASLDDELSYEDDDEEEVEEDDDDDVEYEYVEVEEGEEDEDGEYEYEYEYVEVEEDEE